MKRICPNPMPWHEAFERLNNYAQSHPCSPLSPPKPLILSGWAYSNDVEKMQRWKETLYWASRNGCSDLVPNIPDRDLYFVKEPTNYMVGPMGGPMDRAWDFEAKNRPSSEQIAQSMEILLSRWAEIVGKEIMNITRPLAFTGSKARRLLVFANDSATPPWGEWSYLSKNEAKRRTFTELRASINRAIAPHEVDHIDFTTNENAEPGTSADAKKPRR